MKLNDRVAPLFRLVLRDKFWIALSLILLAGLLLRLPNLNESLWNDEIWSTNVLIGNLKALQNVILEDLHPPFYQVFMFGWTQLFGDSELSVRMPPLLFGLASIFLVYVLAAKIADGLAGRKTALLASFLMAVSPVHMWYSQEARSYSSLLFFLLLSLVAYLKLKEPDARRIWFFVYFGALFSCTLTHFYLAIHVALISMICILEKHQYKKLILAMNTLILACLAAWIATKYVFTGIPPGGGYLGAFNLREFWRLFFTWFLFGDSWGKDWRGWQMLSAQLFFLAVFIYGLTLLLLQKNAKETEGGRKLVWLLFAIPVFLLVASYFGFKGYVERSVFVALPFFYIAIARGVIGIMDIPVSERFGSFGRASVKSLGVACIVIVILLNIFTLKEYFGRDEEWTVYKPNPDWRSTARYLENGLSSSPEPMAIFAVIQPLELRYYNPRFISRWLGDLEEQNARSEEEARRHWEIYLIRPGYMKHFHEAFAKTGARAFYLIHNKYWSGPFNPVFNNMRKDPKLEYQNVQTFKGIEIHKFMLRADATELSKR
ncbi:MAG: glycosyltransferase family 39 protein [Blastocatellales bacterium]